MPMLLLDFRLFSFAVVLIAGTRTRECGCARLQWAWE
jgi:hypothetical protein